MSLESNVATLTAEVIQAKQQFTDILPELIQAKNNAMNVAVNLHREYHIDPIAGNDMNNGSINSKFNTINKALAMTPVGGMVTLKLYSGTHALARSEAYFNINVIWQAEETGVVITCATEFSSGEVITKPCSFFNCHHIAQGVKFLHPVPDGAVVSSNIYRKGMMVLVGGSFRLDRAHINNVVTVNTVEVPSAQCSFLIFDREVSFLAQTYVNFKGKGLDVATKGGGRFIKTVNSVSKETNFIIQTVGEIS